MTEAGGRIGSYRVVGLLGKGGVGSVYLGEHPVIGTKVAIKVIAPHIAAIAGMAERFAQEARASSELDHPHIPRYFDFGVLATGQPYAVMEYFAGESLASLLAREGTLSIENTARIVGDVASAMVQVHAARIVHRDLKPDNLFLAKSSDGRVAVKILDFGIAKALDPGATPTQTSVGVVLGTPYYCAPEQALGLPVGPAADVYALGATAFEMLAGHAPFQGDVAEVLAAKTTRDAPVLADRAIPARVAHAVARMLVRDPSRRISTMAEVVEEVAHWTTPAVARSDTQLVMRDARRSRAPVIGAVAAVLVVLGVMLAVLLWPRGSAVATAIPTPPASEPVVTPLPADEPPATPEAAPPPATEPAPRAAAKPRATSRPRTKPATRSDGVIVDPFAE